MSVSSESLLTIVVGLYALGAATGVFVRRTERLANGLCFGAASVAALLGLLVQALILVGLRFVIEQEELAIAESSGSTMEPS